MMDFLIGINKLNQWNTQNVLNWTFMSKKKILVWLSGGVDSAVSAYLLKEQWYDVSAGFMINYLTEDDSCPTRVDMAVAREVAEYLEIPFFTFDFVAEYEKKVLQYIFDWYKKGLTPNPDVFCNTWIKFDLFRQEALSYGYDAVATWHYAQIFASSENRIRKQGEMKCPSSRVEKREELGLYRGVDSEKDQSYFLSALSREQLSQALFPIGHLPKSEVREIARKAGLPNAERKDSQGLCFVWKVDFPSFLKSHIPAQKGLIVDTSGNIIGEHDGAFQYTIGQRKGIGVGGGPARFVVEKDVKKNIIIVWNEDDPRLFRTACVLSDMNWLTDVRPITCEAQIRYRQKPQTCHLVLGENSLSVTFDTPQRAITPGQVCALYDGDRVLGSGIIGIEQ